MKAFATTKLVRRYLSRNMVIDIIVSLVEETRVEDNG